MRSVRRTSLPARALVGAAASLLAAGLLTSLSSAQAATPPVTPGAFGAVNPARILDTRDGVGAVNQPVAGKGTISVPVLGRGGVPATGVSAVVLNVTATDATRAGALTIWGHGTARPVASTLQFLRGKTVPNQVIAPVGADGHVAFYNGSGGTVDLIADVSGYYTSGAPTATGAFASVAPSRLLDTRIGNGVLPGAVAPNGEVSLQIAGRGGVPTTGASAVVLNVTVTAPQRSGVVTVWAHGQPEPLASNLNFSHAQTIANLVLAPIGADGQVALQNRSGGSIQLVADIAGYYLGGEPTLQGTFAPVAPFRLLDTRTGNGAPVGPATAHHVTTLQVSGRGGVPTKGVSAVEVNVTVTGASTHGVITVWPSGTPEPLASNLNYVKGQIVPNLVLAPLGADGKIEIDNNSGGTVNLVADVAGYFLSADLSIPTATTSHYVRNITGVSPTADATKLNAEGCADARANGSGGHFGLLETGAQTVTAPLSSANPGVLLTSTTTRLAYPDLVTALNGYIAGYQGCKTAGSTLTLAIGTNSDGDFTAYPAATRGADWATKVVAPVQSASGTGVTVAAAFDVEAGFAATEAQAEQWESANLAASAGPLFVNGSADGCPTAFNAVAQSCAPVVNSIGVTQTWTESDYSRLAHSVNTARIVALPQIFTAAQAAQWANIAQTSALAGSSIFFVGALTEAATSATSLSPAQGWAALYLALSTSTATTPASLPISTDLRADS